MFDMGPDTPATYVNIQRDEFLSGPLRLTAPDSQFNELLDENICWQEAPDPIRQSDFWDAGNKVNPWAKQWISSHLTIPYQESIDEQTFHVGKLIGYIKKPMHAGGQFPSVIRANIQEPQATTYGSLYEVSPLVTTPGPAYTSTGFDVGGVDSGAGY
jgi:hypothetical protein